MSHIATALQAPFPYFGGKSRIAGEVWRRLGNVANYVEPFFGSGAVLLHDHPRVPGIIETINDACGFVSNFWRAVQAAPDAVAAFADWPVNECDLHARHAWLVNQREDITRRLEGNPEWFDARIAGWWCWGMCCWIGSGFCSGEGPWQVDDDGRLVHLGNAGQGVQRQLVHLGDAGQGVQRKLVHLGDAGRGVQRKLVHLGNEESPLYEWMEALAQRLRRVRVCCGDWSRVCGPAPTVKQGLTGVFLDPPYSSEAGRDPEIYRVDSLTVAHDVRKWALSVGNNPLLRIALCGYTGEHDELLDNGWVAHRWKAAGGYGSQAEGVGRANARREVIWFSPHCLNGRNLFSVD